MKCKCVCLSLISTTAGLIHFVVFFANTTFPASSIRWCNLRIIVIQLSLTVFEKFFIGLFIFFFFFFLFCVVVVTFAFAFFGCCSSCKCFSSCSPNQIVFFKQLFFCRRFASVIFAIFEAFNITTYKRC